MTAIRPNPAQAPAPSPTREARAAFFQAVQPPAAAARQAPAETLPAAAPAAKASAALGVQPERFLRPGSLLDIKV